MPGEDPEAVILPLIFVLLPLLFIGIGGWQLRRIRWLRRHGVRVPGIVTDRHYSWSRSSSGGMTRTVAAVFSFQTREGLSIHTRQKFGASHNMLRPGQPVTVAYDPDDPERAEILEAKSQLFGAWLFVVLGTIFEIVGLALLVGMLAG